MIIIYNLLLSLSLTLYAADQTQTLDLVVQLDHAKALIQSHRYVAASRVLTTATALLNQEKDARIAQFFPEALKSNKLDTALNGHADSHPYTMPVAYSTLFSAQYSTENDENPYTIDVNIIENDPSIEELMLIINQPDLLDTLDNTALVTIQSDEDKIAVEKHYKDEQYHELNIILNNKLLLNIVANGIMNRQVLLRFCDAIDFDGLSETLEGEIASD